MHKLIFFVSLIVSFQLSAQINTENLLIWLRSDTGIIESTAGSVQLWLDQSGNDLNASQDDVTLQPILENESVNGNPSMKFEGHALNLPIIDMSNTSQVTMHIVYKTTNADVSPVFEFSTNYNLHDDAFILWKGNEKQSCGLNGDVGYSHYTSIFPIDSFHIVTCIWDKSKIEGETSIRISGNLADLESFNANPGMNPNGNENNTNTFGEHQGFIGSRAGENFFFNGSIAEIILYDTVLPEEELTINENYLIEKYDPTLSVNLIENINLGIELSVYPNPTNNIKNINLHVLNNNLFHQKPVITIIDIFGNIIYETDVNLMGNFLHQVDVSGWPSGMYWIYIFSNGELFAKKVIVN